MALSTNPTTSTQVQCGNVVPVAQQREYGTKPCEPPNGTVCGWVGKEKGAPVVTS